MKILSASKLMIGGVLAVVLFLTSCERADPFFDTWIPVELEKSAVGSISFDTDSNYRVTFNKAYYDKNRSLAQGEYPNPIYGKISHKPGQVKFLNFQREGSDDNDSTIGTYTYNITNGELTFVKVEDLIMGRVRQLNRTFRKKK